MESEWRSKHSFAEFAEALGVRTGSIIAAKGEDGEWTVLFTPDEMTDDLKPSDPILAAIMSRDESGILCVSTQKQVGTWAEFVQRIQEIPE